MDINIIKENLKEYDCQLITTINYAGINFAKGLEAYDGKVLYRYFKILDNNEVKEITDKLLLQYFKKMNETNSDEIYS